LLQILFQSRNFAQHREAVLCSQEREEYLYKYTLYNNKGKV